MTRSLDLGSITGASLFLLLVAPCLSQISATIRPSQDRMTERIKAGTVEGIVYGENLITIDFQKQPQLKLAKASFLQTLRLLSEKRDSELDPRQLGVTITENEMIIDGSVAPELGIIGDFVAHCSRVLTASGKEK